MGFGAPALCAQQKSPLQRYSHYNTNQLACQYFFSKKIKKISNFFKKPIDKRKKYDIIYRYDTESTNKCAVSSAG
jgi:hypothetical protein